MSTRAALAVTGALGAGVAAIAAVMLMRPAPTYPDIGVLPCPPDAIAHVLAPEALQCWLEGPNGRWRTLGHAAAHGALVVQVAATRPSDAEAIAQRFVDGRAADISEVVVYVQEDGAAAPSLTKRVQWQRAGGFRTMEFPAP